MVNSHIRYGAEAWTLSIDRRYGAEAFDMQCYSRSLKISHGEHATNEAVLERVTSNEMLATVKSRNRDTSVTSHHTALGKTDLLGNMPGLKR